MRGNATHYEDRSTLADERRALRAIRRRRNNSPPWLSIALTAGLIAAPLIAGALVLLARGAR